MSAHVIAVLLVAWATWGIVLGARRSDVAPAPPRVWAAFVLVWAACGPLAVLLPRS